jgi:phage terminase small subunit
LGKISSVGEKSVEEGEGEMRRKYSKMDRLHALKVLELCGGNISAASRETKIPRKTLASWATEKRWDGEDDAADLSPLADDLTLKQAKFADEYASSGNATDAAQKAGYAGDDNVLAVTGHENLRNPKIQDRIRYRLASAASLTKDEILGTIADHMRGDLTDLFDANGKFSLFVAKENRVTHLIKKLKFDDLGQVREIEIHSQPSASKQLSKIFGLEQKRKDNEHDAEAKRRAVLNRASALAEKHGITPEAALDKLIEARPELQRWVN